MNTNMMSMNIEEMSIMLFRAQMNTTMGRPIIVHEFVLSKKHKIPEFSVLINKALTKYNEKFTTTTAVHKFPDWWTQLVIENINKAIKENSNIVKIPNGCCNTEKCPVKGYFEIVMKIINKE